MRTCTGFSSLSMHVPKIPNTSQIISCMNILKIVDLKQVILLSTFLVAVAFGDEVILRPTFKDVKIWSDDVHISHTFTYDASDPHINATWKVLKELQNLDFHVELQVVQKDDAVHFANINITMDICRILNWKQGSTIANLVYAYVKEFGHLADTCPLPKGEYYLHKFWLPEDNNTGALPELDFTLLMSLHHVDSSQKRTMIAEDRLSGSYLHKTVKKIKS